MVTSKLPDKKVVKMSEQNSDAIVPQRTLLGEVNTHLTCHLCRGYYIDATTIVECLHSFCRSCIIQYLKVKSYCPVCEMIINSAKPNIKPDKALQDIVYKLVPGLFQREMQRRQQFYASRPGHAATATPEQRGEDTERIIFSPEDVISFSLEYTDATDTDSISSKSSDGNENSQIVTTRRYLQCPAVVNICHLKKFLSMKFDIDSKQFYIHILYKRIRLPDYYTLMDIAYIYNWKRNEPMKFFYQIIDFIAVRNRLFDINKGSHFPERKLSPIPTEETAGSPGPLLHMQGPESSTGTDSSMPDVSNIQSMPDVSNIQKVNIKDNQIPENKVNIEKESDNKNAGTSQKNSDEDVEKSQFLNSFELTAKNSSTSGKSPLKSQSLVDHVVPKPLESSKREDVKGSPSKITKPDETLKRKQVTPPNSPDTKKSKVDNNKGNICNKPENDVQNRPSDQVKDQKPIVPLNNKTVVTSKDPVRPCPKQEVEHNTIKRPVPVNQCSSSPKRKVQESSMFQSTISTEQKSVTPLKIQLPKSEGKPVMQKSIELPKPVVKKIPELKGVATPSTINQNKSPIVNKVRMDLLANNCDPTMDRSKILSHVKTSLASQTAAPASGDPLKSLFHSCKINIPSSLSITLTDQKLEQRNPTETLSGDNKKQLINKNNTIAGGNSMHKVPSPPVHNYIEILKLPDAIDTSKQSQIKKPDTATQSKPSTSNKSIETPSSKGPIPSLKPIGETKLVKQDRGFFSVTSPYQQKYIQSLEQAEKSKLPKKKSQVPKLMPASSKMLNSTPKETTGIINKNATSNTESNPTPRSDKVLDLSTSHNIQSQLGLQQTKTLETMQSIANLAKKQNQLTKGLHSTNTPQNSPIVSQNKIDKPKVLNMPSGSVPRPEVAKSLLIPVKPPHPSSPITSSSYQPSQIQNTVAPAQPSPRQNRSPSSSPKLVIAESSTVNNFNECLPKPPANNDNPTQVMSQMTKMDIPKALPGPSKPPVRPVKPMSSAIRHPLTSTIRQSQPTLNTPADILLQQQMQFPQAFLRHMEWMNNQQVRHQYENMLKSMGNAAAQQKDYNKDAKR